MPAKENPTAKSRRVFRNSLVRASEKSNSPIRRALQLPPIIALHLWRHDELLAIETTAMLAIVLLGGTTHG